LCLHSFVGSAINPFETLVGKKKEEKILSLLRKIKLTQRYLRLSIIAPKPAVGFDSYFE